MLTLDHLVIATSDLDAAVASMAADGYTVTPGGEHGSGTTRNALILLADGTYIELLASTGRERPMGTSATDFHPLLAGGDGWAGYALGTGDLAAESAALRARGIQVGDAQPGSRQTPDGQLVRWRLAAIDGGFSPFIIEDETPRNLRVPDDPALTAHANWTVGVRDIRIVVAELVAGGEHYRNLFGQEPLRAEGSAQFFVGVTSITLIPADSDETRAHLERRGSAPYQVTFNRDMG